MEELPLLPTLRLLLWCVTNWIIDIIVLHPGRGYPGKVEWTFGV